MCVDVNVCLSTALPAPIVTISPASDVLTVGQSYTLTCTVMVVPHLVVEPTIQWTRQNELITISSSGTSLQLNFNPLQLSDGDIYTCTANIDITDIATSVSNETSRDVIVMSKLYLNIIRVEMILCLYSTVPQPTVVITRSHNDTVYVGTGLTLTASITFNDLTGVDVPLTVDIIWTRDDDDITTSDTHITVSDVSGSSNTSYTATLIYSPITNDDSGIITTTVTVTPSEISQYIQTATVMTQDIMVDVQGIA